MTGAAPFARAVGDTRFDGDSLADARPRDTLPNVFDDAGHFMPEDDRSLDHERSNAAVRVVVYVGTTYADAVDANENLAGPGDRLGRVVIVITFARSSTATRISDIGTVLYDVALRSAEHSAGEASRIDRTRSARRPRIRRVANIPRECRHQSTITTENSSLARMRCCGRLGRRGVG
jgi:hypothetical protein